MSKFAKARSEKLTDRTTLDSTTKVLTKYFHVCADGYSCQTEDLWQIVLAAAARRGYLEGTCEDLPGAPDGNTVRGHLNEQLPTSRIRALEHETNRALASQWPKWLWSQPLSVACDLHDEPYYGKYDADDPDNWICRGEARDGTTYFYRCATLYVMRKQVRVTLAVRFVHPKEPLVDIVKFLLKQARSRGLQLARLYADKGFCSIPVLGYLLSQTDLSVLMAAPIKGKTGGLRALCRGRRSYRTTHTFRSAEYGELTVPVGVVRTYPLYRDGHRHATWLVYVLLHVPEALRRVRQLYRKRFGIDTSYRLMERVRVRTTSPKPALRFLFMAVALVIINVWISLHWLYLRLCGSGPRRVARAHFTLERMAHFLTRAIEAVYGVVSVVDPPGVKSTVY